MKPQQFAPCCAMLLLSLFSSSKAEAEPPVPAGEIPSLPLLLPEGPSAAPELARRRTDLGNLGGLSTSALAQTMPRIAAAARKKPLEYNHIIIRHVYVGGIANLFRGGSTITSQQFVSPSSGQNGGGFGGNSGGIGGGSSGGFGGGIGGGSSGGFGGGIGGGRSGGFGGSSGGFGGNSGGGIGGFR